MTDESIHVIKMELSRNLSELFPTRNEHLDTFADVLFSQQPTSSQHFRLKLSGHLARKCLHAKVPHRSKQAILFDFK